MQHRKSIGSVTDSLDPAVAILVRTFLSSYYETMSEKMRKGVKREKLREVVRRIVYFTLMTRSVKGPVTFFIKSGLAAPLSCFHSLSDIMVSVVISR